MMHQALDDSDQVIIQTLYYDIFCNKVIIRACIMDSEMPHFLIWSLSSSAWYFLCNPYIPLLVSFNFFTAFSSDSYIQCNNFLFDNNIDYIKIRLEAE